MINASNTSPESCNFNARAPHVAIAAQVDHQGSDIAKILYAAVSTFNENFFGGALLPCFVEVTTPGSLRAMADYRPRTHEGVESHIRISQKVVFEGGTLLALDVLLHEMVHAYMQEIAGDLEAGYAGHGPLWTEQCNRIGALLGLPPVFTKGRGGPNSAQWPLCVRPLDYYGKVKGAPKPKAKVTRKTAKRVPNDRDTGESIEAQLVRLLCQCDAETLKTVRGAIDVMIEKMEKPAALN